MKKIITLSYYSDFSRFFSILSKGFEEHEWVDFSIYPSAYIYGLIHGNRTLFLPIKTKYYKNKFNYPCHTATQEELNWICEYHQVSKELIKIAIQYINFYQTYFINNEVSLVIISGDSRLPARALSYCAKKFGIKVLFFEQGPYNTTILDAKGVNANCSFRGNSFVSLDNTAFKSVSTSKVEKWKGNKKYRLFDIAYQKLIGDPVLGDYKIRGTREIEIERKNITPERKYILLVLQVPEDANMILHSPHFSNHADIVKSVHRALPECYSLVVREHPLYKGKYEKNLYEYIAKNSIYLDNDSNLTKLISNSVVVVVNNSTVGLEAMSMDKSVVVLGDSYYDNPEFIFKFDGNNLQKIIHNAIYSKKRKTRERINYLFNSCFIPGHFRDLQHYRFSKIIDFLKNEI